MIYPLQRIKAQVLKDFRSEKIKNNPVLNMMPLPPHIRGQSQNLPFSGNKGIFSLRKQVSRLSQSTWTLIVAAYCCVFIVFVYFVFYFLSH